MNSDTAPAPHQGPRVKPPFNWSALPLLTGDPDQDWATSTSLLLPFSYRLQARDRPPSQPSTSPACQRPPASWQWQPADVVEATLGQARSGSSWVERRERYKYFTSDTAHVLFGRSKRFTLAGEFDTTRSFTLIYPDGVTPQPGEAASRISNDKNDKDEQARTLTLCLARPELWLFEYPSHDGTGRDHSDPDADDPMACGFIRLEFWFGPDQRVFLADLLMLNERLRYLRTPYHDFNDHGLRLGRANDRDPSPIRFWLELLTTPVVIGDRHHDLISDQQAKEILEQWAGQGALTESWSNGRMHASVLMHDDDRAFVVSTACYAPEQVPPLPAPEQFGAWVSLLNIDSSVSASPSPYEAAWVKSRSYTRWAHYGSLYGFTSHSACALLSKNRYSPTWLHARGIYFDQTRLLLYVRSVVFRFSNRLVQFTSEQRRHSTTRTGHDRQLLRTAERLLAQLSQFITLYQFPLLSNQQQGVEMYALQRQQLDIDELFDEVRREADGSHRYLDVMHTRQTADIANVVQLLGIPLAIAGVIGTLASVDAIGDTLRQAITHLIPSHEPTGLTLLAVIIALTTVLTNLIRAYVLDSSQPHGNRRTHGSRRGKTLALIILIVVALLMADLHLASPPEPAPADETPAAHTTGSGSVKEIEQGPETPPEEAPEKSPEKAPEKSLEKGPAS